MTLVDTSIWVNHFRYGSPRLESLLRDTQILIHPFIVGELACGGLKNRKEVLALLCALPETHIPEHHEVMHLLETQKLYGTGIGWVSYELVSSRTVDRMCSMDSRYFLAKSGSQTPAI
ncbi:type II toxin-antitoxin system VapC family toxin [Candidatus Nitrospira salsa]